MKKNPLIIINSLEFDGKVKIENFSIKSSYNE